jgi:hypothetical protein
MNNEIKISSRLSPLFEYIKKRQDNRKFIETLELSGTFIAITFFLIFAIRPTALTISSLVGEIKSKEILSKEMKSKINNVIIAQDLFSLVQEKYLLIDSSLPDRPSFAQASDQIFGYSDKNNIPIDKIGFSLTDKNYYTTSISTASSFASGLSLISDLLNSRRLIDAPSISFSVGKEDAVNHQVRVNLPLNIYYWSESPLNEKK